MATKVFQNGLWKSQLADGSVFGHPDLNVLCLQEIGNFLFYSLVGASNHLVTRDRRDNQEYIIHPTGLASGFIDVIGNSQYVSVVIAMRHGKHSSLPGELLCCVFDINSPHWLDFSAQPVLNVFREIGSGSKPNFLWVHNGHQVQDFTGNDPGGEVINFKLMSVNEIQWTSQERATSGPLATSFSKWKRMITLPSGEMGPIENIATWPVDVNSPTEPDWLKI